MGFIKIINQQKFTLLNIFLLFYIILNLLDGERGLILFFEKQKNMDKFVQEKELLLKELQSIEKKNNLLSNNIDLDYLEILYRQKLMVGKSNEKIYIID